MATVIADALFSQNLSELVNYLDSGSDILSYKSNTVDFSFDGKVYRDYFVGGSLDSATGVLSASSMLREFGEHELLVGGVVGTGWDITGLNVSASSVYEAALSQTTVDDAAVFAKMFAAGDRFTLSAFDDNASGFGGNDTMNAGDGDDRIYGGDGNDVLSGQDDNDSLFGDDANDALFGGRGADALDGGYGDDSLNGGKGNDALYGGFGNDTLNGATGGDTLAGGTGDDTYLVNSLDDVVVEAAYAGMADLVKSSVDHILADGVENLELIGAALNGTGNKSGNQLIGNAYNNNLSGLEGNDVLDGGDGRDTLTGGIGVDKFVVGSGRDTVTDLGFGGGDILSVASGGNVVATLAANWTANSQNNNYGSATIYTGTFSVNLSAAFGTHGFVIEHESGNATLTGSGQADEINGGSNIDKISGGAGNDALSGGAGNDTLTGGDGADSFIFNSGYSSANVDSITDFTSGEDHFVLSQSVMAKLTVGALTNEAFWSGAGEVGGHDVNDRIILNTDTGDLYYDADGNRDGAAIKFANVGNEAVLYSDFLIV